MPINTYVALDKVTVSGTSTTSVTLSGISSAYTDLRLVINSQTQNSTYQTYIQFNSDTSVGSTNYSTTSLRGDGSAAAAGRHTNQNGWYPVPGPGVGTTGNFQPWTIDIMNYNSTTLLKTGLSRFNNSASIVSSNVHLWRATAQAITSITITAESSAGYLVAGSTFSLYGIKSWTPEVTPKATGGYVYQDSTYYYHAFLSSGTFTPLQSLSCDYLVIAGGGGGGYDAGGGGGAGGLRSTVGTTGGGGSLETALSVTAQAYSVTVGGGGVGALTGARHGSSGTDSTISTITSTGGGGGGDASAAGYSGGSGGGTRNSGSGGTGTTSQGYAGGSANHTSAGSGGGGAGAAGGGTIGTNYGGAGGNGVQITAFSTPTETGVNGYYAGGGGGGSNTLPATIGGFGGGGQGGTPGGLNIKSGISNTGSGGGGAGGGDSTGFANGGSGLVIIRYAK
jgi:hypothetical protein